MMGTNGNITGITDQLEKEWLVERVKVATDRRSSLIRLTAKGKRTFKKMAQSHEAWIQSMFSGLSENSRKALFDALGELKLMLGRSEEHTSELQSLMRISYAVFCL